MNFFDRPGKINLSIITRRARVVKLTINRQQIQVPEGTTVLEAAQSLNIQIPTLCHHKDLSPFGGCRLCVVDIQGERYPLAACTQVAQDGQVVETESRRVRRYRKMVLRLLLSEYHDAGYATGTRDGNQNELYYWAKRYRVPIKKYQNPLPRFPIDADPNPVVWVDLNKCILCTRCVRACEEVQGRFVWALAGRGYDNQIVAGANTTMLEARCESCGACVAYCPTGALAHKKSLTHGIPDRTVTTTCTYCGVGCQLDLQVSNNRIIRVESQPDAPVNGMHLCVKGRYGYDFVHHTDRLTQPMVRPHVLEGRKRKPGEPRGDWLPVDWDTALDLTAAHLAKIVLVSGGDAVGVLTSAKCTNEENYLMNKFTRQVLGTHNLDHCARL
jgi:formate dehydrogenase major subunit/formate dehydrogenase alpha subunit